MCNMWFLDPEEGNPQTDLTAPQVKAVALHCIDYAIMRRAQSWRCLDVVVK